MPTDISGARATVKSVGVSRGPKGDACSPGAVFFVESDNRCWRHGGRDASLHPWISEICANRVELAAGRRGDGGAKSGAPETQHLHATPVPFSS